MKLFFILLIISIFFIYWFYLSIKKHLANRDAIKFSYLGGYPGIKGPKVVFLRDSGSYLEFEGVKIPKASIIDVKLVPRSAVGGALAGAAVGALVAGPVGALVGGAAAAGSPGANNVIQLSYSKNDTNYELFFTGPNILNQYPLLQGMVHRR